MSDDLQLQDALRRGLRAIPEPPISENFDSNVLMALQTPEPWWRQAWLSMRPVLAGGACSLLAMVALTMLVLRLPANVGIVPAANALARQTTSHSLPNSAQIADYRMDFDSPDWMPPDNDGRTLSFRDFTRRVPRNDDPDKPTGPPAAPPPQAVKRRACGTNSVRLLA